jgi:hypothetical protein
MPNVGGTPARALWARTRTRVRVPEAEAFARMAPPPAASERGGVDEPMPWPVASVVGAVAGVAAGAVVGGAIGLVGMPRSSSGGDRLLAGSGWGAVAGVVVGVPAVGVGAGLDLARMADWTMARAADADAARAARMRRAWERRRAAEGGGS